LKHSWPGYFTENVSFCREDGHGRHWKGPSPRQNGNFQVEQSLFRPEHKPKRGQYQAGYPKIHRSQELMGQKIIQGTRQAWQGLSAWVESEGMHELCTYSVDI
jgi:hypothetical protein